MKYYHDFPCACHMHLLRLDPIEIDKKLIQIELCIYPLGWTEKIPLLKRLKVAWNFLFNRRSNDFHKYCSSAIALGRDDSISLAAAINDVWSETE